MRLKAIRAEVGLGLRPILEHDAGVGLGLRPILEHDAIGKSLKFQNKQAAFCILFTNYMLNAWCV